MDSVRLQRKRGEISWHNNHPNDRFIIFADSAAVCVTSGVYGETHQPKAQGVGSGSVHVRFETTLFPLLIEWPENIWF